MFIEEQSLTVEALDFYTGLSVNRGGTIQEVKSMGESASIKDWGQ